MSDTDSFIDEVNEEVQRDRLYGLIRRYGWIAILLVFLIVGGASWNEYRKAQERAQAEAFGDSLMTVLQSGEPQAQATALLGLEAPEEAEPLKQLLIAATTAAGDDSSAVVAVLETLSGNADAPRVYRDLAALKLVAQGGEAVPADIRENLIAQITVPGAPYRVLGLEQQVLYLVEQGKVDEAIGEANTLLQETGVSAGLQQRLAQLIVALGGEPAPFAIR